MTEAELMVELMVYTKRTWGTRVFVDGRVDEYTDEEVRFEDGQFKTRPVPLEWRPLAHLTAEELAALKQQIRDGGYFDLPEEVKPDRPIMDGTTTTWKVVVDGTRHEVTTKGMEPPVLASLRTTLQKLTAEALRRSNQP